jgi:hypothetical protein
MTDKEVLQKAVDRISTLSKDDGSNLYKLVIADEDKFWVVNSIYDDKKKVIQDFIADVFYVNLEWDEVTADHKPYEVLWGFLFHHEFAKAFWGEEMDEPTNILLVDSSNTKFYNEYKPYAWQYHLQQMVLEENPIDYLRKFI